MEHPASSHPTEPAATTGGHVPPALPEPFDPPWAGEPPLVARRAPALPGMSSAARGELQTRSTVMDAVMLVVVLVALALLFLPRYLRLQDDTHLSAMKADLRNLVIAEESYYSSYHIYTTALTPAMFAPSRGVTYRLDSADATGWAASASSMFLTRTRARVRSCHVGVGWGVVVGDIEADPTCP